MPIIFGNRPGRVVMLQDPAAQCDVQMLGLDPNISFESERSIVTRVTVAQQVNVQFLHTLGAQVYVYVFGDRMGQMTLSGLSFLCGCPDVPGVDVGAERMLIWYRANRASRRRQPVRVSIGRQAQDGFVTGLSIDVVDPSLTLVQWGVNLTSLPENN
jgi:hypothetical protein